MRNFKLYLQHDTMQCGLACLRMIYSHYGADYSFNRSLERQN
ncbi:cysteine peptidase family C39 domain-containing protein [Xylanibacter rarus]